jgi:hypothetical protein
VRPVVELQARIDVTWIRRRLPANCSAGADLVLHWSSGMALRARWSSDTAGGMLDLDHGAGRHMAIDLVTTASPLPGNSGRRYWFVCPACGGRRRYLYLVQSWACRGCHRLVHRSTRESHTGERLAARIGLAPEEGRILDRGFARLAAIAERVTRSTAAERKIVTRLGRM